MSMGVLPPSGHHCAYSACKRPAEGIRSPVTGIPDARKLPSRCWEWNLGPLEKQSVAIILMVLKNRMDPVRSVYLAQAFPILQRVAPLGAEHPQAGDRILSV